MIHGIVEVSVHPDCKKYNQIPTNNEYVDDEQRNEEEEATIFKLGESRKEKLGRCRGSVTHQHVSAAVMVTDKKALLTP